MELNITVYQLQKGLKEKKYELIDVREIEEVNICAIKDSKHIPMNTIPESIDQLSLFDLSDVDYIMLDNFSYEAIQSASVLIRKSYPNAKIEVSGNITIDTIASYRSLDIDRISMGCLTHSVRALDLSLLL